MGKQNPNSTLIIMPTDTLAQEFSKKKIIPTLPDWETGAFCQTKRGDNMIKLFIIYTTRIILDVAIMALIVFGVMAACLGPKIFDIIGDILCTL